MNGTGYRPQARMEPTPREVAAWLGGELLDAAAAPERLRGMATLAQAEPDDLSFVASDKALREVPRSRAGVLIVSPKMEIPARPRIVVQEVWLAVAQLLEALYGAPAPEPAVDPTALIDPSAVVDRAATIGPYCVIGGGCAIEAGVVLGPHCILDAGCRVGKGSRLVARVTLAGPVEIGERVVIHPGAVLGADGFKFELVGGRPLKIPQVGRVVIEDDVEIGANTTIDRAFLYETRIGRGTKIDNLVQIAHNVQIGAGCMMAAQVGIAGSTKVGNGCLFGGAAGVRDNVTIGDGAIIGARAGVHTDIDAGAAVVGAPAMPMKEFWRMVAVQSRLPEMARRLKAVETRLTPAPESPAPAPDVSA